MSSSIYEDIQEVKFEIHNTVTSHVVRLCYVTYKYVGTDVLLISTFSTATVSTAWRKEYNYGKARNIPPS